MNLAQLEWAEGIYKDSKYPIGGDPRHWLDTSGRRKVFEIQGKSKRTEALMVVEGLDEGLGEVLFFAVSPESWGTGSSARCWQFFQQSLPYAELWLEVHSENLPAKRFYELQGFEITGKRQGYYRDGGDALQLVKKI
ncbi:MAG: hypothetical protein CL677_03435 [Bdellovibrionaceae bacterium]|nr:hypothetical protein [Pseudobdellovibrionaceae bacterium]